ncbi:hypothetical protein GCM10023322_70740 [Rugosimonospora acidiphila]|uniref:Gfo/Idh/MocA family oxidoreductase n=1 Tax=Rugosimonospora acidiphila TaxID=556531 RepID=A0ABP9SP13_9ACTN
MTANPAAQTTVPVDLAVVGLHFGRKMLDELRAADGLIRVAGVCDLDQDLAAGTAARFATHQYPDLPAVLADPNIQAVALFTGPVGRAGLIRQAIRAGKHVMTTKPFELDPAAAHDVLTEARRRGLVVWLNSPSPRLPADLAQIQQWCGELDLGRPVGAQAAIWASYQETADGSWLDDPERCPVAPICRLGIYLINDLIRLFGPARQVQVMQRRLRTGRPTPDNAHLTVGFDGGVIAGVYSSFCVDDGRPYRDRATLTYERGTVTRTRDESGTVTLELARGGHPVLRQTVIDAENGAYHCDEFVKAVHGGHPGAGPRHVEDIVAGVSVLAAMGRAAGSGRIEDVPAVGV